jgi:sugar phosphate isomerase/epimerase
MTSRRSFLGTATGAIAAATAIRGVAQAAASAPAKPPLGLQLWSLRAQLEGNLAGTLAQIKAWGIDEVEAAGDAGRTSAAFATALAAAGLRCRSMHVGWELLDGSLEGVLKDADALGVTTLVNPSLPRVGRVATREEILRAASAFAKWSERCRAAGKRFGYHIHGHEFGPTPEGTLFDVLAKESGSDLGFEIDVFWALMGGADPVKLMGQYPGRFWYTHLKDMAKGIVPGEAAQHRDDANVPLGTGQIDVKGIVAAGPKAGVEIHYLEDESPDPVANIPKSVAFYKTL